MTNTTNLLKSLTAYERIRDLILSRKKLPGTRLVIAELEKELQIGRGPIREALIRLDKTGLIQTAPHRGAIVAYPPSLTEIKHIYAIRIDLETMLAMRAAKNITGDFLQTLGDIHSRMQASGLSRLDYYELDRELHRTIYAQSGLHHLCLLSDKMMDSLEVFLGMYSYQRADFDKLNEEHAAIIHALESGNSARVSEAITQNVQAGLQMILTLHSHYD